MSSTYPLKTPNADDRLTEPPHATLHAETNAAITSIDTRLDTLESGAAAALVNIEQARLVSNTWLIRGTLIKDSKLILPLITNLTSRTVRFEAATASVLTASTSGPIEIDIVTAALSSLNSGAYAVPSLQSSILTAGKIVIPQGAYKATTVLSSSNGFKATHDVDRYVAAALINVGTGAADLTIQLNRLL